MALYKLRLEGPSSLGFQPPKKPDRYRNMGPTSTTKTWLITGASQGLGLAMTFAALNAGYKVIACARNPFKAAATSPDVERLGGQWLKLDVSSKETKSIVQKAADDAGGIDVVVNNAGYYPAGTIEELE